METVVNVSLPRRQFGSEDHQVDSPNLRDFLRIKEDDGGRTSFPGQTLSSILSSEKRGGPPERVQSNRTLLDIIRDDPNNGSKESRNSWQHFKDKLRIRRQGSGSSWTSSVPVPASDVPIHPQNSRRMISRYDSTQLNSSDGSDYPDTEFNGAGAPSRSAMLQRNTSRAIERSSARFDNNYGFGGEAEAEAEEEEMMGGVGGNGDEEEGNSGEGEEGGGGGEEAPVRMSLMALLAETDRQMGIDGSSFEMEEDEEEEEEEEEKGGGVEYTTCCVCMVRHKGSAFIPCGHTFCRLCSRELWVQRGNCPLCNNFILEILDIF